MSGSSKDSADLNGLSDDERHVERLLAALPPRESRLNRDETMFLAGRALASADSRQRRLGGWVWPAITVCSTAVGLLAGAFIAASIHRPSLIAREAQTNAPVARRLMDRSAQNPGREASLGDSPALIDQRLAMVTRAGDEFLLTKADSLASARRPVSGSRRAAGAFVPLTHGALLGRWQEEEKHF